LPEAAVVAHGCQRQKKMDTEVAARRRRERGEEGREGELAGAWGRRRRGAT
jgi:hypothetical protein